MPELPEVETIRRGLEPAVLNKKFQSVVVNRSDLRTAIPPDFSIVIEGQKIVATLRRGKYILAFTEGSAGFVLHLGMSGRIRIFPPGQDYAPMAHDHVVFGMDDGTHVAFNDPRRFGMLYLTHGETWVHELPFSCMGPEPLEAGFTGVVLRQKLAGKKGPIKTALLDQKVVAGVGNIYACEALFQAGISPDRAAGQLNGAEADALVLAVRDVLQRAIAAGGSSLKDYRTTDGSLGYFQHGFSVYDREGKSCPGCECDIIKTGGINRSIQAGRSTYFCPRKQA
jgi:formamidopyrimidine-DNA glycosylase